jgi:hypothetical protein
MRVLAVVLVLAAAPAALVSWSGRDSLGVEAVGPSQYRGAPILQFADTEKVGGNLVDQTIDARGFDAYGAMRANDSRLWLGIAIALAVAAVVVIVAARRIAAAVLLTVAVGALCVSLINRGHLRVRGHEWVMYTPLTSEEDLMRAFSAHVNAYSAMAWNDARLWLGLAVGFAAAAVGAGAVALRRRS